MMKSTALLLFVGLLLLLSGGVHAEGNCPEGYYPIGAEPGQPGPQGCAPIPGFNNQLQGQRQAQPPQDFPQQFTNFPWGAWGAIAVDTENGKIGAAAQVSNQRLAEEMAMGECKERGGVTCMVKITYNHACVAVAIGDQLMLIGRLGESEEAARQAAMSECSKTSTNCHVSYSDCSLPSQVK